MSNKMKMPLPHEVTKARKSLQSLDVDSLAETDIAMRIMSAWEGSGWHKNEVFFGILIGLQIAQERSKTTPNTAAVQLGGKGGKAKSAAQQSTRSKNLQKARDKRWPKKGKQ